MKSSYKWHLENKIGIHYFPLNNKPEGNEVSLSRYHVNAPCEYSLTLTIRMLFKAANTWLLIVANVKATLNTDVEIQWNATDANSLHIVSDLLNKTYNSIGVCLAEDSDLKAAVNILPSIQEIHACAFDLLVSKFWTQE